MKKFSFKEFWLFRGLLWILLGSSLACGFGTVRAAQSGVLKLHFLDVGQADCILIQAPQGRNMLVDAGDNDDAPFITAYLNKQGITRMWAVVGTHPHADHIGSLDEVIRQFSVGKVYLPKVTTNTKAFEDVLLAVKAKKMKITSARAGVTVPLHPAVKACFLAPNRDQYAELNNYSAVLKLSYGKNSFLLTGDAEAVSEEEMLQKQYDLKADLLKVGHHGGLNSTTEPFLAAVTPQYAVISVGRRNNYKHPSRKTLNRLKKYHVKVFRTDRAGTVIVTSNGKSLIFSSDK